ncbi:hypothetical protein GGS20DRAFT_556620 [Poronia punctata]|nr:hypothetical protein GGS20DRAFT_556620 [Poronia punctata]
MGRMMPFSFCLIRPTMRPEFPAQLTRTGTGTEVCTVGRLGWPFGTINRSFLCTRIIYPLYDHLDLETTISLRSWLNGEVIYPCVNVTAHLSSFIFPPQILFRFQFPRCPVARSRGNICMHVPCPAFFTCLSVLSCLVLSCLVFLDVYPDF